MITQNRLKELLHYDPNTGVFVWRCKTSPSASRIRIGETAGHRHKDGYIYITIDQKSYAAHRLAWFYLNGAFPSDQIDHINHIRSDNSSVNLREASNASNGKNQSRPVNNTSGFVGVYWHTKGKKWRSQIMVNGHLIILGMFGNKRDAIKSRLCANDRYGFHGNHGEGS